MYRMFGFSNNRPPHINPAETLGPNAAFSQYTLGTDSPAILQISPGVTYLFVITFDKHSGTYTLTLGLEYPWKHPTLFTGDPCFIEATLEKHKLAAVKSLMEDILHRYEFHHPKHKSNYLQFAEQVVQTGRNKPNFVHEPAIIEMFLKEYNREKYGTGHVSIASDTGRMPMNFDPKSPTIVSAAGELLYDPELQYSTMSKPGGIRILRKSGRYGYIKEEDAYEAMQLLVSFANKACHTKDGVPLRKLGHAAIYEVEDTSPEGIWEKTVSNDPSAENLLDYAKKALLHALGVSKKDPIYTAIKKQLRGLEAAYDEPNQFIIFVFEQIEQLLARELKSPANPIDQEHVADRLRAYAQYAQLKTSDDSSIDKTTAYRLFTPAYPAGAGEMKTPVTLPHAV